MKYILFAFAFVLILSSCKEAKKTESKISEISVAQEKPTNHLYEDLEGKPVALADFKGKRVVLNFWATWCKPCIEEMPAMARAEAILKENAYVFLFASDQDLEKIKAFRDRHKFGITFLKYHGEYADLQITALPVSLIFNQEGEQVERLVGGAIWDSPEMLQKLKLVR